jgi:hypothetical protein
MAFRFNDLFPTTIEIPFLDGRGEPTGATLKVVGADSQQYIDAAAKAYSLAQARKREAQIAEKAGVEGPQVDDPQFALQLNIDLVASCIVGWTGMLDDNDQEMPFSKEKVLALVKLPYARQQVENALSKSADFFRGGKTASGAVSANGSTSGHSAQGRKKSKGRA